MTGAAIRMIKETWIVSKSGAVTPDKLVGNLS